MSGVDLKIMRMHPEARMPFRAHPSDAGADIHAFLPEKGDHIDIEPGQRATIGTGLKMSIPAGYEIQIRPRSGLAHKYGITVLNSPGTIDSAYRGEIGVILINLGNSAFRVASGDRIAQMILAPVIYPVFHEVDSIDETDRGEGGFGSTGISTGT